MQGQVKLLQWAGQEVNRCECERYCTMPQSKIQVNEFLQKINRLPPHWCFKQIKWVVLSNISICQVRHDRTPFILAISCPTRVKNNAEKEIFFKTRTKKRLQEKSWE